MAKSEIRNRNQRNITTMATMSPTNRHNIAKLSPQYRQNIADWRSRLLRRPAALDVGIIASQAQGAGDDCIDTMIVQTHRRADGFRARLDEAGIEYRDFMISCNGRPHLKLQQMFGFACQGAQLEKRNGGRGGATEAIDEDSGCRLENWPNCKRVHSRST